MKYKVLMFGRDFVNIDLLYKGIYSSTRPTLFEESDTIDSLSLKYQELENYLPNGHVLVMIENLQKCRLNEVNLEIQK